MIQHLLDQKQLEKVTSSSCRDAQSTPAISLLKHFCRMRAHFYPDASQSIEKCIKDPRQWGCRYSLPDLVWSGILLFALQLKSRHAFNQYRKTGCFKANYERLFKQALPHLDSVDYLLEKIDESDLEQLLSFWVHRLMEKKVLDPFKTLDHRYIVALDGTGVVSFDHPHCAACLCKVHRGGKKTWFHPVVEARLVGWNGFSLPLAVEWIANPTGVYTKQDCELKAGKRLLAKLHGLFKRARFVIVADALYVNAPFMGLCQAYGWSFILNLKPRNLPTLWEEVKGLTQLGMGAWEEPRRAKPGYRTRYRRITDLRHDELSVNFVACEESPRQQPDKVTRYSYVTDLDLPPLDITNYGRQRWRIENEGFNVEKHQGYHLAHLFKRCSLEGLKKYHLLRLMGELFNQLVMHWKAMRRIKAHFKVTWQHIFAGVLGCLAYAAFDIEAKEREPPGQIRYAY